MASGWGPDPFENMTTRGEGCPGAPTSRSVAPVPVDQRVGRRGDSPVVPRILADGSFRSGYEPPGPERCRLATRIAPRRRPTATSARAAIAIAGTESLVLPAAGPGDGLGAGAASLAAGDSPGDALGLAVGPAVAVGSTLGDGVGVEGGGL